MQSTEPAPITTKEEIRLKNIVLTIRELRHANRCLAGAKFFCAHATGLQAMVGHIPKLCKDINDMINFLDKIYKASPVVYTNVKKLYDSLEIIVEKKETDNE